MRLQPYRNLSGDSGVTGYAVRPDGIVVRFRSGELYEYTRDSAGAEAIAAMQRLAREGRGLSAYIATTVRDGWARKLAQAQ